MRPHITRERVAWTLAALLAFGVALTLTGVARGGDLEPSTPPASSMKTLADIEPATAITSIPTTIDEPGAYYLAAPIEASAPVAIEITASDVTVDFRGLPLIGDGTGTAVHAGEGVEGVELTNGTLAAWGVGVSLAGTRHSVSRMLIIDGGTGIDVTEGIISDNQVINATGPGIVVTGGVVRGNVVSRSTGQDSDGILVNDATGTLIESNRVAATGGVGIRVNIETGQPLVQDNHVTATLGYGYDISIQPIVLIRNSGANETRPVFEILPTSLNVIGCFAGPTTIATAINGLCNVTD